MSSSRSVRIVALVMLVIVIALAACSTTDDDACVPPPGSCDGPAIEMNPLDTTHGCLAAPVALTDVCNTSVNRCVPSAGISPACAFAPDGGIFVTPFWSDNDVLTAKGWRFALDFNSLPVPFPADQVAMGSDWEACARALCAKACPGVDARFPSSCADAGDALDAAGDAPPVD